jgi:hypothetical protein
MDSARCARCGFAAAREVVAEPHDVEMESAEEVAVLRRLVRLRRESVLFFVQREVLGDQHTVLGLEAQGYLCTKAGGSLRLFEVVALRTCRRQRQCR